MTYRIYLRVSTDEQAESQAGMNAQLDACQKYAKDDEGQYVVYSDEGVSGATDIDQRDGMIALMAEINKGDVLLVAKRDRLGRDPYVLAMLECEVVRKKGCRIVSVAGEGTRSDDPSDVLMRLMVDAFSVYERLMIKTRTKAALRAKKSRGERVGSIPYGYMVADDGVHLEKSHYEQSVIAMAKELYPMSYRGIGEELAKHGYRSRSGKVFLSKQIQRMVSE